MVDPAVCGERADVGGQWDRVTITVTTTAKNLQIYYSECITNYNNLSGHI